MGKEEEAEGPPPPSPPLPAGERENPERTNPDSCNNYANDFGAAAAAAAGSDGRQKREGGRGTKKGGGGGRVSEIGSEASRGKGRKKGGRIRKGDKALELGCGDYKIAHKSLFFVFACIARRVLSPALYVALSD